MKKTSMMAPKMGSTSKVKSSSSSRSAVLKKVGKMKKEPVNTPVVSSDSKSRVNKPRAGMQGGFSKVTPLPKKIKFMSK